MAYYHVAIFAEGQFERLESFETRAEADAYSRGLTDGAGLYGAGGCGGYVLPDNGADMLDGENDEENKRAVAAYRAACSSPEGE